MKLGDAHAAIGAGLVRGEPLWRPKPFHEPLVAWRAHYPTLHRAVKCLSDGELDWLQRDVRALHTFVAEHEPSFAATADWSRRVDEAAAQWHAPLPPTRGRDHVGVPGKKWRQVEAFASAMPKRRLPAVEYCSGKGFLSQRLVAHGAAAGATCLELDATLCASGTRLAAAAGLPLTFVAHDVLADMLPHAAAERHKMHVALHACGGLHTTAYARTAPLASRREPSRRPP
jgi:hypothetical protein